MDLEDEEAAEEEAQAVVAVAAWAVEEDVFCQAEIIFVFAQIVKQLFRISWELRAIKQLVLIVVRR